MHGHLWPIQCQQLLAREKKAGLLQGRLTPPAPRTKGLALTFHRSTFVRVGVTFSLPLDPPDYPSILKQVLAFEVKQLNLKQKKKRKRKGGQSSGKERRKTTEKPQSSSSSSGWRAKPANSPFS